MRPQTQNKPVIGLVGGVGAGKSLVASEFASLGCALVDGDAIGHILLDCPDVQKQLRRRWGDTIFRKDGSVHRKALGQIVFGNPAALAALNAIMTERIGEVIEQKIAQAGQDPTLPAIVLDAAILFEAGWDSLCTHVLFVDAPEPLRRQRAAERGLDEPAWRQREKSQISLDSKRTNCYGTLDNSSSASYLREQARRVFFQIVPHVDRP